MARKGIRSATFTAQWICPSVGSRDAVNHHVDQALPLKRYAAREVSRAERNGHLEGMAPRWQHTESPRTEVVNPWALERRINEFHNQAVGTAEVREIRGCPISRGLRLYDLPP
jgi:hypothetical protein